MPATKSRLCDNVSIEYVYSVSGTYDGTAAMVDMRGYDGCMVLVLGTVSALSATDHLTGFKIVSNTTAAGAGTDHDIAEAVTTDGGSTKTLTSADIGAGAFTTKGSRMLCLDVRNDQMYAGDRYIGAVTAETGTLEIVVIYIKYHGTFSFKDMFQATRTAFQYDGPL